VAVRPKTAAQQLVALSALPVTVTATVKRGWLRWEGRLQPTPLSDTYLLRIEYAPPARPQITVVRPELDPPDSRDLPHVFPGNQLCLCYPSQWDGSELITRTLLPWAAEWLLHYELWKFTHEWHGGGHEPRLSETDSPIAA
jgi:hypothetical protein